jgi:hypothetical protein
MIQIVQAVSIVACMGIGYFLGGIPGSIWGVAIHRLFPALAILQMAHKRQWLSLRDELMVPLVFAVGVVLGIVFEGVVEALGLLTLLHLD